MDPQLRDELIACLAQFVTPNKVRKIRQVLENRTYYVTLVLEDIYQPQNASATIRTAECLGVQTLHVIENRNEFRVSPKVTQGAAKWITLFRYNEPGADNTGACVQALRSKGYQIIATSPNVERSYSLDTLPLERPMAFLFGNEEEGLSPRAMELADGYLRLPMYGFTQSYNISVSVAITLSHVIERLHRLDLPWRLSEEEKAELTLEWYRRIVRRHELLEQKCLEERQARQAG